MTGSHALVLSWRDGRERVVRANEGETVLDAAERAEVCLPVGCRTGACTTCTGRVREGRVAHRRSPRSLKSLHLDAGYALLCLAEPRTNCRIDVGVEVQRELIRRPRR